MMKDTQEEYALVHVQFFQESYNGESSLGDVWFLQGMTWSILIKWKGITTDLFSNSHFDCSKQFT